MKKVDLLAAVLVVVGAVNWGLVGLAHIDLVATVFGMKFGQSSPLSSLVYALVGVAGLYQALVWPRMWNRWRTASVPARQAGRG